MQALITSLTDKYVALLDPSKDYFTPSDLEELGFPSFLTRRISLELENNLADSIVPPKSDWANMNSESVIAAWEYFLYAIHEATRLPVVYARSVIETSIADILELLVEPRKNIPSSLFLGRNELSLEDLQEQASYMVVQTAFANALPKYMVKRGLGSLSGQKCAEIVAQLDHRLTANFTALQWAQQFEPWYQLMGDEIDSELVRLFFLDKNDHTRAARFDIENGSVSKTELIEILTPPVIEDEDFGYLYSTPERVEKMENETLEKRRSDESSSGKEKSENAPFGLDEPNDSESSLDEFELENDDTENSAILEEEEAEVKPVYQRFQLDIEEETVIQEQDDDEETSEDESLENEESDAENRPQELDRSGGDKPLWAQFLPDEIPDEEPEISDENDEEADTNSPSLVDIFASKKGENESEKGLADAYLDEFTPILDLEDLEREAQEKSSFLNRLHYHLSDMQIEFIDQLFGESEDAYLETVEKLSEFEEWPQAGKYLVGDFFRMNMIDRNSEIAVEFVNRIQAYFLEKAEG